MPTCPDCRGSGIVPRVRYYPHGNNARCHLVDLFGFGDVLVVGEVQDRLCKTCEGKGEVPASETLEYELATVCPYCRKRNDVCVRGGGSGRSPEPGDIMLCAQCGELAVFAEGGPLRKPTEAETFGWSMDPAFAPVARARVLARLRADTGVPVAVVGVAFGADGSVSVTGLLPPEVLDDYIKPRGRRGG